jgi:hypothetical protein
MTWLYRNGVGAAGLAIWCYVGLVQAGADMAIGWWRW